MYSMGWLGRSAVAACVLLCASTANAQGGDAYPTGLDLVKRCNALNHRPANEAEADPELQEDYGYCLGFLVGYVSGFAAVSAQKPTTSRSLLGPKIGSIR